MRLKSKVAILLTSLLVLSGVQVSSSASEPLIRNVTFEYFRADQNYSDWSLWLWNSGGTGTWSPATGTDGNPFRFNSVIELEDGTEKVFLTISISDAELSQIGFIVRTDEWLKDGTNQDRYVNLPLSGDIVVELVGNQAEFTTRQVYDEWEFTQTSADLDSALLQWINPINASVSKFKLLYRKSSSEVWTEVIINSATFANGKYSYILSNMDSDTFYFAKVSTFIENSWTDYSSVATLTTAVIPSSPSQLEQVSNSANNSLNIKWGVPSIFDAISIDQYKIEYQRSGTDNWLTSTFSTNENEFILEGLESSSAYKVRLAAHSPRGWGNYSNIETLFTNGTRKVRLLASDESGFPVTGGSISWSTIDGEYSSATPIGFTANGIADVLRMPAANLVISVSGAKMSDGTFVTRSFTVESGVDSIDLTFAMPPTSSSWTVKALLPNGLPVANANVVVEGVEASIEIGESNFYTKSQVFTGKTNELGEFRVFGYGTGMPKATVTINDGVLVQSKSSSFQSNAATVTFNEMPWLDIEVSESTVNLNSLVKISTSLANSSPLSARFTKNIEGYTSSGISVSVVPPAGAKQKCAGKDLNSKTNGLGKAILKVCATKSGLYRLEAKGAIVTGAVTLKVKKAPPMAVTSLSAISPAPQKAKVAWNAPQYSGGATITSYIVQAISENGMISKTLKSVNEIKGRTFTFNKLKSGTKYVITVIAVTKFGQSEKARTEVGVA